MKQFPTILLVTFIVNVFVVDGINIIIGFKVSEIDVLIIAAVTTLIGLGLAWLLKIAIRMARDHQA